VERTQGIRGREEGRSRTEKNEEQDKVSRSETGQVIQGRFIQK
jgi:hypothetical protein